MLRAQSQSNAGCGNDAIDSLLNDLERDLHQLRIFQDSADVRQRAWSATSSVSSLREAIGDLVSDMRRFRSSALHFQRQLLQASARLERVESAAADAAAAAASKRKPPAIATFTHGHEVEADDACVSGTKKRARVQLIAESK